MKKIVMLLCAVCWTCTSFAQSANGRILKSYVNKPVNHQAIDKVIGAESRPGSQCSAFEKDGCLFSVWVYSNWQESSLSVYVLLQHTKDAVIIMKDFFIIDSKELRRQYPGKDLGGGIDNQYKEENGKWAMDNLLITIYDYGEKDAHGENPEYYTRILKAWTIDKKRLKFTEIPTKGLTHYNEGYGA